MGLTAGQFIQIGAAFIGLGGTLWVYWRTNVRQQSTQRAETYMKLEMEASRIFEIARTNARLVAFLNGEFKPQSPEDRAELEHQVAWYVPQILNLFEISISFYKRKIFEREIFSTWVSWYLEVASAEGFIHAWAELRPHYKSELRAIMECGIKAGNKIRGGMEREEATRGFFKQVSDIVSDTDLLTYYDECQVRE